jgi:hypothetical protein
VCHSRSYYTVCSGYNISLTDGVHPFVMHFHCHYTVCSSCNPCTSRAATSAPMASIAITRYAVATTGKGGEVVQHWYLFHCHHTVCSGYNPQIFRIKKPYTCDVEGIFFATRSLIKNSLELRKHSPEPWHPVDDRAFGVIYIPQQVPVGDVWRLEEFAPTFVWCLMYAGNRTPGAPHCHYWSGQKLSAPDATSQTDG